MTGDPRRREGARGDDGLAVGADGLERAADDLAPCALALVALRHLGVREDHAVTGRAVLRPGRQRAVAVELVAAVGRIVGEGQAHGPESRTVVPAGPSPR